MIDPELAERQRYVDVRKDELGAEATLGMLDSWWQSRIYDARDDCEATTRLLADIAAWRTPDEDTLTPTTVAFTSGVFDLLHVDHHGYLLRTKAAAIPVHFDTYYRREFGRAWSGLSQSEQGHVAQTILESNEIKLVVSIDGDKSVALRKGNDPNKGGSRPVLGWNTRARQVASLSLPGGLGTVVDAVTLHGPEDFENVSPHASLNSLVAVLQPDVWSVYFESTDVLESAPFDPRLVATTIVEMPSSATFFSDELIAGKISTTAISRRIRGQ